ncbi:MAG: hypothetical protein JW944_12945 [Deltaproteobacteria bacterium]|nr:hypothetical protein [Deltaproteobacteria bacterium]
MRELIRDKKKIILGLLILVFAVSLVYRVTHPYRQQKVDTLTYTGVKSEAPKKEDSTADEDASTVEAPLVLLDMFYEPPVHSREQTRNIFSMEEETDEASIMADQKGIDRPAVADALPGDNENILEDDLSSFRTFGYMETGKERVLFLEKGEEIILIRKGDRIEGKYLVEEITRDELALRVIPSKEMVYIDLGDL